VDYSKWERQQNDPKERGLPKQLGLTAAAQFSGGQSHWIVDSGATHHICNQKELFKSLRHETTAIGTGKGQVVSLRVGQVEVALRKSDGSFTEVLLHNVLYSPDFLANIVSNSALCKRGAYFHGLKHKILLKDGTEVAHAPQKDGLPTLSVRTATVLAANQDDYWLHHRRLGHPGPEALRKTIAATTGPWKNVAFPNNSHCDSCAMAKSHRIVSRDIPAYTTEPFQLVHTDTVGPVTPLAIGGFRFFLILVDDFTRSRWVYLMHQKNEALSLLKGFWELVSTQSGRQIKAIRVDNGTEYGNC
jgi:hypothetical protein